MLNGYCIFYNGFFLWNPVLAILGALIFVVGIQFLIAYLYRIKTGRDTFGIRFWIWVFKGFKHEKK